MKFTATILLFSIVLLSGCWTPVTKPSDILVAEGACLNNGGLAWLRPTVGTEWGQAKCNNGALFYFDQEAIRVPK